MSVLAVERHATHWTLTLNRPDKMNALNAELVEALIAALDEAEHANLALIVLRGAGRCFSAGFDMKDIANQSDGDLLLRFVRIETLLQRVAASSCATLALAHGRNFGAGVDLLAACRIRIGAMQSTYRMPGLKFGLVLGARRFARLVGGAHAQRILGGAQTFDVDHAAQIGFIDAIASVDDWGAHIADTLRNIEALPAVSRRLLARALENKTPETDMAVLVRSAAEPGLRDRISRFLAV